MCKQIKNITVQYFFFFLRCYVISVISSSLQWIPLSELFCFLFPAQNSSSLFGNAFSFHGGFDSLLPIPSELRSACLSLISSYFFTLSALPHNSLILFVILLVALKSTSRSCLNALADVETKVGGSTITQHHWD